MTISVMRSDRASDERLAPLDVYLAYSFLPAAQYADVLMSINRVHEALRFSQLATTRPLPDIFASSLQWPGTWAEERLSGPPLSIEWAVTGSSITFGFDVPRTILPSVTLKDGDLRILLPQWTGLLVLTGAALTVGLDRYDQYLDIRKKELEIEALEQAARIQRGISPGIQDRVRDYSTQFRRAVSHPNISTVVVSGFAIKESSEEGK